MEIGDVVGGRWQISHHVATSDLGELYEAYDVERASVFAVKVLGPRVLGNRERWSAFVRLARRSTELLGACAARIEAIEVDGASGCPFIVSESVAARPLDAVVESDGPVKPERVLSLLCRLAEALEPAHAAGLAHRSLKPSNVLLADNGTPRLTDFALGALREDAWAAPPAWCAPELMAAGAVPSPQSDAYALALLAFFALTGRHAFEAAEPLDRERLATAARGGLRTASARAAALGKKADLRLDRWFSLALEPDPTRRFQTTRELATSFGQHLGLPVDLAEPRVLPATVGSRAPQLPLSEPSNVGPSAAAAPSLEAPRPMVVLDQTQRDPSRDSGIVSVSARPLLFSEDLPRPPAASTPALTPTKPDEAPAGVTAGSPLRRDDALAATLVGTSPLHAAPIPAENTSRESKQAGALSDESERSEGLTEASHATDATDATASPVLASPSGDARVASATPFAPTHDAVPPQELAPKPKGITVSPSVVIAVGLGFLGMGLAMLALVLWALSDRGGRADVARAEPSAPPLPAEIPAATQSATPAASAAAAPTSPPPPAPESPEEAPASAATQAFTPSPGMAGVTFECSPVPCEGIFCDAERYDATRPVELTPGKHVCKGVASGYGAPGVTVHLAEGQHTVTRIELSPRKQPAASGKKKPCGTFINPCK